MDRMRSHQLTFEHTYEWTDALLSSLRTSVRDLGFKEMLPALLSKAYEPGAKHMISIQGNRELPKLYTRQNEDGVCVSGHQAYYLPVSHVVEKQMALEHLKKVYCLAPCLRLVMDGEDSSAKHLYNFF